MDRLSGFGAKKVCTCCGNGVSGKMNGKGHDRTQVSWKGGRAGKSGLAEGLEGVFDGEGGCAVERTWLRQPSPDLVHLSYSFSLCCQPG